MQRCKAYNVRVSKTVKIEAKEDDSSQTYKNESKD